MPEKRDPLGAPRSVVASLWRAALLVDLCFRRKRELHVHIGRVCPVGPEGLAWTEAETTVQGDRSFKPLTRLKPGAAPAGPPCDVQERLQQVGAYPVSTRVRNHEHSLDFSVARFQRDGAHTHQLVAEEGTEHGCVW